MSELPKALYIPDGDGLQPTGLTRGPWDPQAQHAGPPAALLARAISRASAITDGQTARLSFDILRPVPLDRLTVSVRTLRPGRRVEQLDAALAGDDGTVFMRATAWRVRTASVDLPADAEHVEPPPPGPEHGVPGRFGFWRDEVAYHRALEWSFVEGGFEDPGPATVWTRLKVPLVDGEEPAPLERLLVMADAASGVSAVLDWERWMFINVDLGIHLRRPPEGDWMAMAARTSLGSAGAGLCLGRLYDSAGLVGFSTQSLLVEERKPAAIRS